MKTYQITETHIPSELSDCVTDSVISIFNTMFGGEPATHECDEPMGEGIASIISYVGDISWLMMLSMPKESVNTLALKFTGFEIPYDSPDMGDVVGELANVLAGDIVARLAKDNIKVAMSLPTIMRGNNVEPILPRGIPSQKIDFVMSGQNFSIKIAGAKEGYGRKPGT